MKTIYISRNGNQEGPYSEEEINSLLAKDELALTDFIWSEGMSEWSEVSAVLDSPKVASIEEHIPESLKPRSPVQKQESVSNPASSATNQDCIFTMDGVNDLLQVYDDRVSITPQGFMGLISKGLKGTKTIPFQSITAIQFKLAGFTTGYIQFTIPGGHESHGGVIDAGIDENTFMFYSKVADGHEGNKKAEKIKNYIESKLKELRGQKSNVGLSMGDEIAKLVALKAQGALSEEEFQTAKKRLIG